MSLFRRQPCAPCGPQPVCYREPQDVYGSGRLYLPTAMAMQLPGKAYLWGSSDMGIPISMESPCAPSIPVCAPVPGSDGVSFIAPRNPDNCGTSVVGGGIFEMKQALRWNNPTLGIHHGRWALPGYIAREPDEGWWVSEGKDEYTGARAWITNMVSGLGSLGGRIFNSPLYRTAYPATVYWRVAGRRRLVAGQATLASQLLYGRPTGGGWVAVEGFRQPDGSVLQPGGTAGGSAFIRLADLRRVTAHGDARPFRGLGFLETTGSKVAAFAVAGAAAFGLWYFLKKGKKRSRRRNRRGNCG